MSVTDELHLVDVAYRDWTLDNTDCKVPEHCSHCGAPMKVKSGWKHNDYDSRTGEVRSYEAQIVCSRKSFWHPLQPHSEHLLIWTPAKFTLWWDEKNPKNHLTILSKGY